MARLSVVLPTYNERENIAKLIEAISQATSPPPEIIVVDDNSPDKTWQIVTDLQGKFPTLKPFRRRNERGLASALAYGVSQAGGDTIGWMDCDFSHPPSLIPEMLRALDDADLVIASRYVRGGSQEYPFIRDLTSRAFNLYASILLGFKVRDWTSGYALVKRKVLEKVRIEPVGQGYGEYFFAFVYGALGQGFRVKEVPYRCVYNGEHESKTSTDFFKLLGWGASYGLSALKLRLGRTRQTP
ncbi:MAG: polyprenol monophosphomannose synthase [Chloroflexota bacterium]